MSAGPPRAFGNVVLLVVFLAVTSMVNASCREVRPGDEPGRPQLLLGEIADADTLVPTLARRQRVLLQALAERHDVGDLMHVKFTFVDAEHPEATLSRDVFGRPAAGMNFFRTLAVGLAPERSRVHELEVIPLSRDHAVVITHHPTVSPSITRWTRIDSIWKATSLAVNVSPKAVITLRRQGRAGL